MRRADEKSVEEQVKKDSATEATAGAKTLCIPLEQPELPPGHKVLQDREARQKLGALGALILRAFVLRARKVSMLGLLA